MIYELIHDKTYLK